MRARRSVSTATHVAAKTLPPIAICPTNGTEKVSVKIVTPHAQTSIAATTASKPKIGRGKTASSLAALAALAVLAALAMSMCSAARKTSTQLNTTFGPPSGSAVAGNQRQAKMASNNAPCVHALKRGNTVAFGSQEIVVDPVACAFAAVKSTSRQCGK